MAKNKRAGGKYKGHTTLIPAAATVCSVAENCQHVYRICPGFITAGLPSNGGRRNVKIADDEHHILLTVRDTASKQEVRVYARDRQAAKLAIARGARNEGLHISFRADH